MSQTPGSYVIPISKPGRGRGRRKVVDNYQQQLVQPCSSTIFIPFTGEAAEEEVLEVKKKLREEGKVVVKMILRGGYLKGST